MGNNLVWFHIEKKKSATNFYQVSLADPKKWYCNNEKRRRKAQIICKKPTNMYDRYGQVDLKSIIDAKLYV
jgi:hypothetical protein